MLIKRTWTRFNKKAWTKYYYTGYFSIWVHSNLYRSEYIRASLRCSNLKNSLERIRNKC